MVYPRSLRQLSPPLLPPEMRSRPSRSSASTSRASAFSLAGPSPRPTHRGRWRTNLPTHLPTPPDSPLNTPPTHLRHTPAPASASAKPQGERTGAGGNKILTTHLPTHLSPDSPLYSPLCSSHLSTHISANLSTHLRHTSDTPAFRFPKANAQGQVELATRFSPHTS